MSPMFSVFPIFFVIVVVGIFAVIIFAIVSSAVRWNKNNHSPLLTVSAKVAAKREDVSIHGGHADANMSVGASSSTWYYATFEVESGDRMELTVPGKEYGMLAEGDMGRLTFQGTRFKGFERS